MPGLIAEAFVVAFRFPNLFRRWFGEGAFNSAFVPLFTKRLAGEGPEAPKPSHRKPSRASLMCCCCSVGRVHRRHAVPDVPAGAGVRRRPEKFDLAVTMSRIAFPYLLCMSLVALLSGVLNAVGKFVESSMVSIVLNMTLIGRDGARVVAWLWQRSAHRLRSGLGHFRGGAAAIAAAGRLGRKRNGMLPRLQWPRMTPGMKQLVALGVPGAIAGGVTQINIVIGGMIASLHAGAVSHLFYADRLYELPLAMVGIAIGVVLLPDISRHLRAGNEAAVMDSQNRALELAMLLTVPAAVALAVIPTELVSVLYERGAFKAADRRALRQHLRCLRWACRLSS